MPSSVIGSYAGDAAEFGKSLAGEPWLILAAAITIYIVLGVLYESFIHPLTILSTLPSAGVGALLALMLCGYDLSVVALIGIVLLMGIVKKNAIMMIDFALDAEREQGMSPRDSILQASILRFRPIMMTTLAALFGALPLALESGTGSELRNPLGITIIGGLLLSQLLTLYTTPVIYLLMERVRARIAGTPRDAVATAARSAGRLRPAAAAGRVSAMNFSELFIRRPIGTVLIAIGIFLTGAVAYQFLPVASMPSVDFPTINVTASRPGADPETMAATVAAPLERKLGIIPGVVELTSRSSLGSARISIQFDLNRNIDGAARDVQAALNAALADLPGDLQSRPSFKKSNPAAIPIMILALTSKSTVAPSAIYDAADTVIAQRLSQVQGVSEVSVNGAEQPAIRVRVNPVALASMGLNVEDVRTSIVNSNAAGPLGVFDSEGRAVTIGINDQLRAASQYDPLVVRTANGTVVRLSAVASIEPGVRNSRSAGWYNGQPSVLLVVTKQGDRQRDRDRRPRSTALLPDIKRWVPADIDISVLSDRTGTIRASVHDMQLTLLATICLVMLVVFLFLRRVSATIAAGVTVPLALAGTCAAMWAAGFSIDNISLMALAVAVGFVVDDAIVMIENMFRNLEKGMSPMQAALEGARQIGFTVISISISLVAAFIPLLFMGGVVGRVFREFSVTLAFAIAISTLVSLSVTPMICAHFVRGPPSPDATLLRPHRRRRAGRDDRLLWTHARGGAAAPAADAGRARRHHRADRLSLSRDAQGLHSAGRYRADLCRHPGILRRLLPGDVRAAAEGDRHHPVAIRRSPASAPRSAVGGGPRRSTAATCSSAFQAARARGVTAQRGDRAAAAEARPTSQACACSCLPCRMCARARARPIPPISSRCGTPTIERAALPGRRACWRPHQDIARSRGRDHRPAARRAAGQCHDRSHRGGAARRAHAGHRQRAQQRLLAAADFDALHPAQPVSRYHGDRSAISARSVRHGSHLCRRCQQHAGAAVGGHQGGARAAAAGDQSPGAVSLGDDQLRPRRSRHALIEEATRAVDHAVAEMHMPDTLHADYAGDARVYRDTIGAQLILIGAALVAVYIVLGVLYESLAHPLTIISTLPSAGLGALLALQLFHTDLSLIAFIGIILLIGIVKKNGIMMVDFALDGERNRGLTPERAIYEASLARFRPIMMTTLAALLGALPLVIASGPGSELRRPLGITIMGGLLVSQTADASTPPR